MPVRIWITLLILWLAAGEVFPQVNDSSAALFSIGARVHRGFIIQHTEKLSDELTASNPWMVEADLNWHLRKRNTWEYCHCYPRSGGYSEPNLGMNFPSITAGIDYSFSPVELPQRNPTSLRKLQTKKQRIDLVVGL